MSALARTKGLTKASIMMLAVLATGWSFACTPTIGHDATLISNAVELAAISVGPNCAPIRLANDIDLGGDAWTPIGTAAEPFQGTFDGDGFTLYNVAIDRNGTEGASGFFGTLGDGATVKNLILNGVTTHDADVQNHTLGALAGSIA